jgi:drug/metabolite transporter (DMT)-like permease
VIGELSSFLNALSNSFCNTLGGKSTQITTWRNTLRLSSVTAFILILFVMLFNLNTITLNLLLIGFAAGFIGGLGLPFLYKAFSIGAISFVSPVVALVQSMLIILFAVIIKDEQLSITFPIAATLGGIGIYLCSRQSQDHKKATWTQFLLAFAAAALFCGFSFFMTYVEPQQILPALFGARIGVITLTFIFAPKDDKKLLTKPTGWRKYAILSGTFEIIANLFFMLAINNLELNKVAIIIASAPALSVLVAIKLLHQRPSPVNWVGIAATTGALALIAVG